MTIHLIGCCTQESFRRHGILGLHRNDNWQQALTPPQGFAKLLPRHAASRRAMMLVKVPGFNGGMILCDVKFRCQGPDVARFKVIPKHDCTSSITINYSNPHCMTPVPSKTEATASRGKLVRRPPLDNVHNVHPGWEKKNNTILLVFWVGWHPADHVATFFQMSWK